MIEIKNVKEYDNFEEAVKYIHSKWGSKDNYDFYKEAMIYSSIKGKLPQFYVMLKDKKIIGCSALITNDFVSRHDLYPWVASLYVEKSERGNSYGKLLLEYAEQQAKEAGFNAVYLTTNHDGYYEQYGYKRIEDCYTPFGGTNRVYQKKVK